MAIKYTQSDSEMVGRGKLKSAKNTFRAIILDQDGTVKGGTNPAYTASDVSDLLKKIIRRNTYPVVITGSGASALKSYSSLQDYYSKWHFPTPTYIGIGNGAALYRFDSSGRKQLYFRGLTVLEGKAILQVWKKMYRTLHIRSSDLQPTGLETIKRLITTDWKGYIPPEYIQLVTQYAGKCFAEPIKVSVIFPVWKTEKQRELVRNIQKMLDRSFGVHTYTAIRGDDTFLHITRSLKIDSKLFALQTIMKLHNLRGKDVVVIGDMPLDNDKGLLVDSRLPYTFTNHEFERRNSYLPPYVLTGSFKSPIGSVYSAIAYLLL